MAGAAFSTFDALAKWGRTLPAWQRCLLVRLLESTVLSEQAIDEVFTEYLLDHGLATATKARSEWKIELPQQPAGTAVSGTVLARIQDVSGVNALAVGESLSFGSKLTVVYGPNGSGKSGYARVLKAACFTRSKNTGILGDVKVAKNKQPKPSATFLFEDGKTENVIIGQACPRLRDGFAVFDATCVHVHLDDRNTFQVMPYLFDTFPRMVDVFARLQAKLRQAIQQRKPLADKFAIIGSETEVANLLTELTESTNLVRLQALSAFSDKDDARLAELVKQIAELATKDPKEVVKANEQRIADLTAINESIAGLRASLSSGVIAKATEAIANVCSLSAKMEAVSATKFASEPVQPIGTAAWRGLLSAAIEYNDEAHPSETFPVSGEGARCVLCQQPLDGEAAGRLARFFQFVTSDLESAMREAKQRLGGINEAIGRLNFSFFGRDAVARRALHEIDQLLEVDMVGHIEGYRQTAQALETAIASCTDPGLEVLDHDDVSPRVQAIIDRLRDENETLRLTDQKELIEKFSKEKALLDDRKKLSSQYADIASAVEDLKWVAKASNGLRSFPVTQREVTSKQKTMMEELVAKGFVESFVNNCDGLALKLPVRFKFAGDAGYTDRKIEIAHCVEDVDPSEVLSEGEQTVAALADFLTEIELNGSCVGLVFDDPVTSMDHMRKEAIARRLVDEANKRQVIVFTHDILFTNYLAVTAEELGVSFVGRTVWRDSDGAPGAVDRLAFPHDHYEGAAHDRAKKHLEAAKTLTGDAQCDALEKACGSLRTAYEDFTQKKLFGNVVRRWRENITFTLDRVCFDEGIAERIHERMVSLSRYIDAHSHSPEFHEKPLTLDFVTEEIIRLDEIKSDYSAIYKAWETAKKPPKVFT